MKNNINHEINHTAKADTEGEINMQPAGKKKSPPKSAMITIGIALFCIIIACIIYFVKYIYDGHKAANVGDYMDETISEDTDMDETETMETNEAVKTNRMLKLEELQKKNEDIVAWIEIEDTNISYPVVQGSDNDFYLNHDFEKKLANGGALFLDMDFDLEKPSTNYLIYGHRQKNGTMFEDLLKYKDEEFYKEHPTIRFTTNEEDVEYDILAVFYSRVYYQNEKNVFRYYYFIDAEDEAAYDEYVSQSKKASIYDTGVTAEYTEQLLTLSTCEYSQEDGRFAVVAVKKNK